MGSLTKKFVGNAPALSTVWAFSPQLSADTPNWSITMNGKTLKVQATSSSAGITAMQKLWAQSSFPEFKEVKASIPTAAAPATNPQGGGTNEIQALYISGTPTGGSFQLVWGGASTPFILDPTLALSAADSGSAGNPNGAYKYTYTWVSINALGQTSETKPSPEATVTVTSHSVNLTSIAAGPLGTIARRIYRTAAGGATGTELLVATIWDNSTTTYTDNISDGSLGAAQPTANLTGIPYNATATQLQGILQTLAPILPGNVVVTGSGTAAAPWLVQFANSLGSEKQALILPGSASLNYTVTVPAGITPTLVVTEIQQGLAANAQPDAGVLLLVGKSGVPFYCTSEVSGTIPPTLQVAHVTQGSAPNEKLTITAATPTVSVARTTTGKAGTNEVQMIEISPNAESGSYFTLSFGGHTTNNIPTPPGKPSAVSGSAGNPNGNYYYVQTFITANGETEPSLPSSQVTLTNAQGTVTITNGPSGTTEKRVYRTLAGGAITGPYYLAGTVADNTTTTFTDNVSDATLKTNPQAPTTNGCLQGELEALASVGQGNVQVSGANASSYAGQSFQVGYSVTPPSVATAASTTTAPSGVTLTAAEMWGALSSGTYYYVLTAVDAQGETVGSTEVNVNVTGPTGSVAISWTAGTNAKGYRIYRGTASGVETTLIGTAAASATSFIDYGSAPAPIAYKIEFIGSLANAAQSLVTGSVANITILPTITLSETQAGYPVQNEIQQVGWSQKYGNDNPSGTFTINFPSLNFTTGAIQWNATAAQVLAAIQKAAPAANFNDFSVAAIKQSQSGYVYQITYQGMQQDTAVALAKVSVSGITPASGDQVSPYNVEIQPGSPVGRNQIIKATINNSPTGGTFTLTGTLADGNTISASGVAYNASAATLQAAFPAGTTNVSGSAGGPYTIEAVGEAGAQRVVWQASSSLTGASSVAGSPPASNTTSLSSPTGLSTSVSGPNSFGAGTPGNYYYKVTAVNSAGETLPSAEASATVYLADSSCDLGWNAVAGASGYNIYRGTSAGGENLLLQTSGKISSNRYADYFGTASSASPPVSNSAGILPPTQYVSSINSGAPGGWFTAGTYYYKVTATNSSGETTGSNEISYTIQTDGIYTIEISWGTVTGATGYKVYRGTSAGSENVLVGTMGAGSANFFADVNPINSATSPPNSNTTQLSVPVQNNTTPSASGGNLATATYYYEITATNANGETTASNEKTAAVTGPTGSVALSWNAVTGASGYRIYRGTSAGAEGVLAGIVTSGATVTFTDTGSAPASFTASEVFAGAASANEVQTITVTNAGGGYFTAEFDGQASGEIAWNAAAATMQTLLQAIPTISSGNCTVSLSTATAGQSVWTVTFAGSLAAKPQPLLTASSVPVNTPPSIGNGFTVPTVSAATYGTPGTLAAGTYYYVVTTLVPIGGETGASNEVSFTSLGSGASASAVELTWGVNADDTSYRIYRGTTAGGENLLIGTAVPNGAVASFVDDGSHEPTPTLQGGAVYTVSLSTGATDNFTLSYGGQTTSSIAATATASTVQTDLQALSSIGSSNATVTGNAGGPWTVSLANSVIGTSTLTGTVIATTSSGAPSIVYVVTLLNATGGTFQLNFGGSATIAYNATASAVKTALEGTQIGTGNVTVSGGAGAPWTITITPTPQNQSLTLTAVGSALKGTNSTLTVYPLVYTLATGPNFWDAPANWSDGSLPSAYIVTPPAVANVIPLSTDSTLVSGTHGSLTSGTTYYYKITATNANGETNGGTEGSGQAFAGCKFYFNGTASAGTFSLTYGGQTASGIAYNASASTIQSDLQALSSIGSGNCTVTGTGTSADPFIFQLAGTLAGKAPTPLSANSSGLTGATISTYNYDTRTLAVVWNEIATATGYKVYRGTSAGSENVLVATITSQDQTCFIDDGTYTTTSASPNTAGSAWHNAVGDDVYFTNSTVSCWYGIAADISNGYSIHGGFNGSSYLAINSLTIDSTFTGKIGLPAVNSQNYQEYRPLALELNGPPSGSFSVIIGNGAGAGSNFINLDTGTSQISMVVNNLASPTGKIPVALLWVGVNIASEIDVFKGDVGIAVNPGDVAQLATIRQAYQTNPRTDTYVQIGAGCETITNFYKNGGDSLLSATATNLTGKGGTITQDAGACTNITLENCTYASKSTTALGDVKVSAGGVFDRSQDSRALSIGTVELYAGASYLDPHGETVTTGQTYLQYQLIQCGFEDVTLKLGKNVTAQRTQN